ncbi:MAG: GPW/gp25 family protein [Cyanobium sp.]
MPDPSFPPSAADTRVSPLGSGWSFPPSFDRFSGGVNLSSDIDNVRENLQILFSTDRGERIMLETYGTMLRQRVFAALTETTTNQLKLEIRNVIAEWEPRIDVLDVQINDRLEWGGCELVVLFELRTTAVQGSMTYPFNLTEATPMQLGG